MRPVWKGALSFGLVHIPVRMYAATEKRDVAFRYLHRVCGAPIRYEKVCPVCHRTVEDEELALGYEYEKDRYVLFDAEELSDLVPDATRTIDIQNFVRLDEVDPIYFNRSYYLEPDAGGQKPFALLRLAMRETGKVAVARLLMRRKTHLVLVRTRGRALLVETLFDADEIRDPEALSGLPAPDEEWLQRPVGPPEQPAEPRFTAQGGAGVLLDGARISEAERSMAQELIEHLTAPWDPRRYPDVQRSQLNERIAAKIAGRPAAEPAPRPAAQVIDLVSALEASLNKVQAGQGQSLGGPHAAPAQEGGGGL